MEFSQCLRPTSKVDLQYAKFCLDAFYFLERMNFREIGSVTWCWSDSQLHNYSSGESHYVLQVGAESTLRGIGRSRTELDTFSQPCGG